MDSRKQIEALKTLTEVLEWKPLEENKFTYPDSYQRSAYYLPGEAWHEKQRTWERLLKIPLKKSSRDHPKTIMCHDMMGGYLQDRFLDGCEEDGYVFRHWSLIDIFIYFSHHLITIPPVGWIAAARKHGVSVLGTIITEWDEGQELLEKILENDDMMNKFVSVCSQLCSYYGFHGWLLNIENKVKAELVPKLLKLVEALTAGVKHEVGQDGVVLWYDSVTIRVRILLMRLHQLSDLEQRLLHNWMIKDTKELAESFIINPPSTIVHSPQTHPFRIYHFQQLTCCRADEYLQCNCLV